MYKASVKPIGIPAKPAGAFLLVAPKMTIRKINVRTTYAMKPDAREKPPGDAASFTVLSKAIGCEIIAGESRHEIQEQHRCNNRSNALDDDIDDSILYGNFPIYKH